MQARYCISKTILKAWSIHQLNKKMHMPISTAYVTIRSSARDFNSRKKKIYDAQSCFQFTSHCQQIFICLSTSTLLLIFIKTILEAASQMTAELAEHMHAQFICQRHSAYSGSRIAKHKGRTISWRIDHFVICTPMKRCRSFDIHCQGRWAQTPGDAQHRQQPLSFR